MSMPWMAFHLFSPKSLSELNTNNNGKDRFENIPPSVIDNVYLTQKLEWIYQLFMLGLLVLFSLRHAISLYTIKQRITTRSKHSVLYANENEWNFTSQQAVEEEETLPLLSRIDKPGILMQFKAWSIQPAPNLPILGSTANSNAQFLFFFFFSAVNLLFFFVGHLPTSQTVWVLGYRSGGMIISNLPWLYLLSAKNQPLKFLTGYSYESLNICHRALGYMICLLALCHVTFIISGFYILSQLGATGPVTLGHFLRIKIFILGEVAFGCYLILFITSLRLVRRKLYELFLSFHVVFQLAALFLVFFHHPRARISAAICLLIFLMDRILFRLWLKSSTLIASADISADGETCLLSADIALGQVKSVTSAFKESVCAGWHAGQHVFVSIPELGGKYAWQAHPFSISSVPPRTQDMGLTGDYEDHPAQILDILIRTHDGFSRDLFQHSLSKPKVCIRVDGPYGSSVLPRRLFAADRCLFIAGGTGIAVISPLAQATLQTRRDLPEDGKHALIWVVKDEQHRSWAPGKVALALESASLAVLVPSATKRCGRPPLTDLVYDVLGTQRDESLGSKFDSAVSYRSQSKARSICVVVSGPEAMVHDVRHICSALLRKGIQIDLHIEKFGM